MVDNDIKIDTSHNEGKSGAAEQFIRILKKKVDIMTILKTLMTKTFFVTRYNLNWSEGIFVIKKV